jgi:hypothetical protein
LGVFGDLAFMKKIGLGLLEIELSLFRKITMLANVFNPLTLWVLHEKKILNFSHLA